MSISMTITISKKKLKIKGFKKYDLFFLNGKSEI
jgi:hypothetical protein